MKSGRFPVPASPSHIHVFCVSRSADLKYHAYYQDGTFYRSDTHINSLADEGGKESIHRGYADDPRLIPPVSFEDPLSVHWYRMPSIVRPHLSTAEKGTRFLNYADEVQPLADRLNRDFKYNAMTHWHVQQYENRVKKAVHYRDLRIVLRTLGDLYLNEIEDELFHHVWLKGDLDLLLRYPALPALQYPLNQILRMKLSSPDLYQLIQGRLTRWISDAGFQRGVINPRHAIRLHYFERNFAQWPERIYELPATDTTATLDSLGYPVTSYQPLDILLLSPAPATVDAILTRFPVASVTVLPDTRDLATLWRVAGVTVTERLQGKYDMVWAEFLNDSLTKTAAIRTAKTYKRLVKRHLRRQGTLVAWLPASYLNQSAMQKAFAMVGTMKRNGWGSKPPPRTRRMRPLLLISLKDQNGEII